MSAPDPIATQIGQNIRRLRASRGLSLASLAISIESSPATLYQLECGVRRPTVGRLVSLALALGVDTRDLLAGLTDPPEVLPVREQTATGV